MNKSPRPNNSGRNSERYGLAAPAMIYQTDGNPLMACIVVDISATGAKLTLSRDEQLPARFMLSLTRDTNVMRACEPAWQLSIVAGIRFCGNPGPGSSSA